MEKNRFGDYLAIWFECIKLMLFKKIKKSFFFCTHAFDIYNDIIIVA